MSNPQMGDDSQSIVLFDREPVRRVRHEGRWFYSVVDTCAVLAQSTNPTAYWRKLKQRLHEGHSETVTNCHGLKLRAPDGKMRETDCADTENLLRIIQEIPSPNAEPFKRWLASVGADIIEDAEEDRLRLEYRQQGIEIKQGLHDEIHTRGVQHPIAHAEFERRGHQVFYDGETIAETEDRREIPQGQLQAWMGSEEIADNFFRDAQSRAYIRRLDIQGRESVMQAHETVSQTVRDTILDLGNTPPEQLPTAVKSIDQARKDEQRRAQRGQNLFDVSTLDGMLDRPNREEKE